jgi:hypothetical protein
MAPLTPSPSSLLLPLDDLPIKLKYPIHLLILFQKLDVWNQLKTRIGFKVTYPNWPNVTRT